MRIAIVHYWLTGMRGGEKVLEQLCELYPDADIFTLVVIPEQLSPVIRRHRITPSFIQSLPFARSHYQRYLPLMPIALEQFDLNGYDLVISSESGPAKGVVAPVGAVHVCYCHSPMRYIWNMYHDCLRLYGGPTRLMMRVVSHYLRVWDYTTATRVDRFIANSKNVAGRIERYYGRPSTVVYPPVDIQSFTPTATDDGFYLMVGSLVPYKRTELAVDAFNRMRVPLVIIGGGSELSSLQRIAGNTVTLCGPQPTEVLRDHYARCKALIFPGEEDFGIVPIEAMASGKPVIAYGRGGVLESVIPGLNGHLFHEQTVDGLINAVEQFEKDAAHYCPTTISDTTRRFSIENFCTGIRREITNAMEQGVERAAKPAPVFPYPIEVPRVREIVNE
jgi:glycosyltransferase involved in cell wall biosynthesis